MANEQTRPNFFRLLDLDPDAPWSESKFEETLKRKRGQWSRDASGIAKTALAASKNLRLIPDIRRVMLDPALRKAEAQAAKQEQRSGRKERLQKFEEEIELAQGKGYLEEDELAAYIKDFKDILSEQEIRKRVRVPIRKVTANREKTVQMLEASIMDSITSNLNHLNKADLYELFSMGRTVSNKQLIDAATNLATEMRDKQPKDDVVTANIVLAGHAKTIFSSDEMRKKYNESLRQQALKTLFENLDSTVNRTSVKEIHPSQVSQFVEQARKAGFSAEDAQARLKEHATQRRWAIVLPSGPMDPQQRCGACQELNTLDRRYCNNCGKELSFPCPNCGRVVSSDELRCEQCGFPVGNWYRVDDLLKHAEDLLALSTPLKEVSDILIIAERAWQPENLNGSWSPKKSDARYKRIMQLKVKVNYQLEEKQNSVEKVKQLIASKELFAARQLLSTLDVRDGLDLQSYRTTIDTKINEASNLLKRAQGLHVREDERFELCRRTLQICRDHRAARDLLSTLSLPPPDNAQAKVSETLVNLLWDPSPIHDVKYKIIRKSGSRPVSVNDGVIVATIAGCIYDDTKPEIGIPLYYAVFSECEGVTSTQYASVPYPVLLTQDVCNEQVRVNNQAIVLSWQAPPNVHAIQVVRKERTVPRDLNDGILIRPLSLAQLIDQSVQQDVLYFYKIYCQFKNASGQLISSAGKTISATAETPPDLINDLQITNTRVGQKYQVVINWKPPTKGSRVIIIKSSHQPTCRAGDTVPVTDLGQHGSLLEGRIGTVTDIWNASGIAYYTPAVLFNNTAYIGMPQRYVCMEEVRELRVQLLGSALRLVWLWPENCAAIEVSYSYNGWPQAGNSTTSHTITRIEYDQKGYFDIRGLESQDCYINVACIFRSGSEQLTTEGIKKRVSIASKTGLRYAIKNPTFLHRHRTLHIFIRTPGAMPSLPAMVLLMKRNGLPFNQKDGEILKKIPAGLPGNLKEHTIPLPDRIFPPNTFAKLFLEDDDMRDVVTIYHDEESMRLQ